MGSPNFRFKQFTVWHDRCAMKVGTDGVLLGAWCPLPTPNTLYPITNNHYNILDIGTGSGLIALMLAQRLSSLDAFDIDAIDIDSDAVAQAQYNFGQSPWSAHLHAHHSTLQTWSPSLLSDNQYPITDTRYPLSVNRHPSYHLIVSNPPYFQDSLKNPNAQRAAARHTDTLSYEELIMHSARLLAPNGTLALVLPFEAKDEILSLAREQGLSPTHITHIHSKPSKPAKRLLIALSPISDNQHPITDTMYIESENAPRSEEYQALTKDFYL